MATHGVKRGRYGSKKQSTYAYTGDASASGGGAAGPFLDDWIVQEEEVPFRQFCFCDTGISSSDARTMVDDIKATPGFLFARGNYSTLSCMDGCLKVYSQWEGHMSKETLMEKFPHCLVEEPYFMQTVTSLVKKASGYGKRDWFQYGHVQGLNEEQTERVNNKQEDPNAQKQQWLPRASSNWNWIVIALISALTELVLTLGMYLIDHLINKLF